MTRSLWFSSSWFTHRSPAVIESSLTVKILRDFSLQSASHHLSNDPDIFLFDYVVKKIYFIQISCPTDGNVLTKVQDKIHKYQSLPHDYHVMYRIPGLIIPVVVGCAVCRSVVSSNRISHLQCIPKISHNLFLQFKRQPSLELFMSYDVSM